VLEPYDFSIVCIMLVDLLIESERATKENSLSDELEF
jgi:hypothetical protein